MSGEHGVKHYLKIWVWLLILFVISLGLAEPGILILTLISAFVIAVVKAGMVCAWFMHLNTEKKYIWWLFYTCLAAMGLFYIAIFPDIGRDSGTNWENARTGELHPDGGDGRNNHKYTDGANGETADPHAGHAHAEGEGHASDAKPEEASAEEDSGEAKAPEAPADTDAG